MAQLRFAFPLVIKVQAYIKDVVREYFTGELPDTNVPKMVVSTLGGETNKIVTETAVM